MPDEGRRDPDWAWDEIVLACDLVMQNGGRWPPGGGFGVNVFLRDGDTVYRTWHTNGRGIEQLSHIGLIDVLPYGRQEQWQDSPDGWPQSPTYSSSQDIAAAYGPDA